eukprot:gene14612-biopygen14673
MWAAAGILFLVVFVTGLAKLAAPYKKGTLKSLPWHSGHEVFWGCAKHLFKRVVRENALMHEDFLEQHRANGFKNFGFSIVGGKTEIVVCEPEDIKCILKDSYANFEKDKAFQHIFEELLGEGIFVVNGSQWKEQRVVASHFFNRRFLFTTLFFPTRATQEKPRSKEVSHTNRLSAAALTESANCVYCGT